MGEKIGIVIAGIYLLIMAVFDWKTKMVPVVPGIFCAVAVTVCRITGGEGWLFLAGAATVGALLYIVSLASREKVGRGDALVYLVTGLALGLGKNIELLMFSLLFASAAALFLVAVRRVGTGYRIAFVPFTAAAFGVVVAL